jgi:hypothetical protein
MNIIVDNKKISRREFFHKIFNIKEIKEDINVRKTKSNNVQIEFDEQNKVVDFIFDDDKTFSLYCNSIDAKDKENIVLELREIPFWTSSGF